MKIGNSIIILKDLIDKKLIVILGPTASGKTDLSIKLAKKFNGEIISADSRQVYKGLNIGTGKITKNEMEGIPHHLLDVASLKRKFTVAQFQKLALKKIREIQKRNRVSFLVGGTGFYIQSIVDSPTFPEVKPDWKLRKKLEKKTNEALFSMLKKLDPERAESIDRNNPKRLIRALEIILTTGKIIPKTVQRRALHNLHFGILQIGIKKEKGARMKAIQMRLKKRLKAGLIREAERLHQAGLSLKRMEELGLEYRFASQYLQGKLDKEEMVRQLEKAIWHFSKRQMTWFKRDKRILWVKNQREAEKLITSFLKR